MDIRTDNAERRVKIFPRWARTLTVSLCVTTVAIWYFIAFEYAILAASSVLGVVGIATVDAWNRELRQDGYASLTQLYSGYFAALFLFSAITPALFLILGGFLPIAIGLGLSLFYAGLLSSIAFRDVEDQDRVIETYTGPAVVYIPEGPYIEHTEEVALESRTVDEGA